MHKSLLPLHSSLAAYLSVLIWVICEIMTNILPPVPKGNPSAIVCGQGIVLQSQKQDIVLGSLVSVAYLLQSYGDL